MRSGEAMELLGFPPYSRPSPSEVKAAYRRMVMESHPDRVPAHQKPQAESKFKQISEAYSFLKDGRRSGNRMEVHVMRYGVPRGYGRSSKTLVKAPFLLIICAAVSFGSYSASEGIPAAKRSLFLSEPFSTVVECHRALSRREEVCVTLYRCQTISAANKTTGQLCDFKATICSSPPYSRERKKTYVVSEAHSSV